jgi:hypothetical protein
MTSVIGLRFGPIESPAPVTRTRRNTLLRLPSVGDNAAMEADPPKAAPPKRKRRWFQFSLRTLLIGVTLLAVLLGVISFRANRQRMAVEAIKKLDGKVAYDFETNEEGWDVRDDARPPGPNWLRNLIGVDYFATVVAVKINTTKDTDDGSVAVIRELPHLRSLVLTGPNVTDSTLDHLKGLIELRGLYLFGTQVTDAGLGQLENLSGLEILHLRGSNKITDAGLRHLRKLTRLEFIDLAGTAVSEAGMQDLKRALPKVVVAGPALSQPLEHAE